jgi:hypothetical protein
MIRELVEFFEKFGGAFIIRNLYLLSFVPCVPNGSIEVIVRGSSGFSQKRAFFINKA